MARPGCSYLQRSRQKSALHLSSKEEGQTAKLAAALLKEAADYHRCGITASMPPCRGVRGGGCLFAPLRGKAATFGKRRRVQSRKSACSIRDSRELRRGEVVGEAARCDACFCRSEADFPGCTNLIGDLVIASSEVYNAVYWHQVTRIESKSVHSESFFQSINKDCPSPICYFKL